MEFRQEQCAALGGSSLKQLDIRNAFQPGQVVTAADFFGDDNEGTEADEGKDHREEVEMVDWDKSAKEEEIVFTPSLPQEEENADAVPVCSYGSNCFVL